MKMHHESQKALLLQRKIAITPFFTNQKVMHSPLRQACALATLTTLFATTACKTTEDNSEAQADAMLGQARELLAQRRYAAARDTILTLRQRHPMALEARSLAILTLDSVELLETRDSLERYEAQLEAERAAFAKMQPRLNGATNDAYYAQQRLLRDMEFHYDELCAKVKFYLRKIDIDSQQQ